MQKVAEAYAHSQSSFRYNSHSHSRPKLARSTSQKTVRIHSDVDHLRPRRQSSLGSFSSGAGRDDLQFLEISGADAQLKYMAGEVNVEDIAEAQLEFVALLRAEFWAAMQNGHLSHLALSALLLACDRGEVRQNLRWRPQCCSTTCSQRCHVCSGTHPQRAGQVLAIASQPLGRLRQQAQSAVLPATLVCVPQWRGAAATLWHQSMLPAAEDACVRIAHLSVRSSCRVRGCGFV